MTQIAKSLFKILYMSLFFSIAVGGIFRETNYYYQTPGQYYSESNERSKVSRQQYQRAQDTSYDMYYSKGKSFNELYFGVSFAALFVITGVGTLIFRLKRKSD